MTTKKTKTQPKRSVALKSRRLRSEGRKSTTAKASERLRQGQGTTVPRTPVAEITLEQQIIGAIFLGKVRNYFSDLHVFALRLEAPLALGDTIRIKGHTTDLTQKVERMQVDHLNVQSAAPGEAAAIPAADKVRLGDAVYRV